VSHLASRLSLASCMCLCVSSKCAQLICIFSFWLLSRPLLLREKLILVTLAVAEQD